MQKEKELNYQDSEITSQPTDTTHIGSDDLWLEVPEKLKGIASFNTDLPEINTLTQFEATAPKKKSDTKINVYVRRKDTGNGNLF
jgi:hypothetical protein